MPRLFAPRNEPQYYPIVGWVGAVAGLDILEKKEFCCPNWDSNF